MRWDGRKFGKHAVNGFGVIDIRVNSETGEYFATFLGKQFKNKDLLVLKSTISAEAERSQDAKLEPVIKIEKSWSSDFFLISYRRGFKQTIQFPDGRTQVNLTSMSLKDDDGDENDTSNWEMDTPIEELERHYREIQVIPFTRERWAALQALENYFTLIRDNLSDGVLNENSAKFLDEIYSNKQLDLKKLAKKRKEEEG